MSITGYATEFETFLLFGLGDLEFEFSVEMPLLPCMLYRTYILSSSFDVSLLTSLSLVARELTIYFVL